MKKFLVFLICVMCVMSLTACKASDKDFVVSNVTYTYIVGTQNIMNVDFDVNQPAESAGIQLGSGPWLCTGTNQNQHWNCVTPFPVDASGAVSLRVVVK